MAANYWLSTQCNKWLLTRSELLQAREEDCTYSNMCEISALTTWCINGMQMTLSTDIFLSYNTACETSGYAPKNHCNSMCLLFSVLQPKLVRGNRSDLGACDMCLCRRKSGRRAVSDPNHLL